jgi:hypothetical protein
MIEGHFPYLVQLILDDYAIHKTSAIRKMRTENVTLEWRRISTDCRVDVP